MAGKSCYGQSSKAFTAKKAAKAPAPMPGPVAKTPSNKAPGFGAKSAGPGFAAPPTQPGVQVSKKAPPKFRKK